MNLPSDQGCVAEPKTEIEKLRERVHFLETCCVIELAVINPSVMDWMKHWEGRALKAEAMLAEPDPAADPVQMKHGRWNLADDGFGVQSADDGVYCYYADAQERVRELERRQQRAAGYNVKRCVCLFDENVFADKPIEECGYHKAMSERAEKAEQERDALAKDAKDFARYIVQCGPDLPDHACAQCVPHGDILKAGFVCAYHKAIISGRDAT